MSETSVPYQKDHESLRRQIAALKPGESFALAKRLDQDKHGRADIVAAQEALHDTARNAMGRAKKDTGAVYMGELGNFRTNVGLNPVVVFVVTRVDDANA